MATSMKEYGVLVDVLCMDHLHLVKNSDVQYGWCTQRVLSLFKGSSKNLVTRFFRRLFAFSMLKSIIKHYDLIDFHVFSLDYLPYMTFCKKKGITFDITLWGSDILRAKDNALKEKEYGFENCRYIKSSDNVLAKVTEKYTGVYRKKYKTVFWGNNDYENIDSLLETCPNVKDLMAAFLPEADNRIVVTCGYNGSKGQNHLKILESIGQLPIDTLKRVFLLLPLTYGAEEEYIQEINNAVQRIGVPYKLFTNRISSEEIALIRVISSVVVNMQETDGFSSSLQGHLYCNNVLIIAEWLNYVPLDNANVYYIKTSIEDIRDNLATVLSNLSEYKEKCSGNHAKMAGLTSWSAVLPRWAEYYLS